MSRYDVVQSVALTTEALRIEAPGWFKLAGNIDLVLECECSSMRGMDLEGPGRCIKSWILALFASK
jgi:hypothetical protein